MAYSPTLNFIDRMPLDVEEFSDATITDLDGGIDYSIHLNYLEDG